MNLADLCILHDCERRAATANLCAAHYKRYMRGERGARLNAPIRKRRKDSEIARTNRRLGLDNGQQTS